MPVRLPLPDCLPSYTISGITKATTLAMPLIQPSQSRNLCNSSKVPAQSSETKFKTRNTGFEATCELSLICHVYSHMHPQGMKSYQAYQRYPVQVNRLQEIEPKIAGGCTAVVAIVANHRLYIANVGDSRAMLIYERANGTLFAEQLSVDHTVENEDEVERLEALGLDRDQLAKAGRLGSQENTRSIGTGNTGWFLEMSDTLSIPKTVQMCILG